MIQITWDDGECNECGDAMKVVYSFNQAWQCKACKMLDAVQRIAYALELKVGIE